jgi:hypothetical protein
MRQLVLDAQSHAVAVFRRLLRVAPVIAGLMLAALCLDAWSIEVSAVLDGQAPAAAEQVELETNESPDASDEIAAHVPLVVAPAAIGEVTTFATRGTGRSGFRSRVPRPSGT